MGMSASDCKVADTRSRHTNEILNACREALIALHVVEKVLGIAGEAVEGALGHEAVDLHVAVVTHMKVPVVFANANGARGGTEWGNTTKDTEPGEKDGQRGGSGQCGRYCPQRS